MPEVTYTEKGVPVIDLDEYGTLTFSEMTKVRNGYRYFLFRRTWTDQIAMKVANRTKFKEVEQTDRVVLDMMFRRGKKGMPRGKMPAKLVKHLRTIFDLYTDDNNVMPFEIPVGLKRRISNMNLETIVSKTKRKLRKGKKK